MGEPFEAEGGPLHALDEVVGRFGGTLGDVGSVPGGDLVPPADQGASEGADLGWTRGVLEVDAELVDHLEGEVGVAVVIEAADHLLCVPGIAYFASEVAGIEQATEAGLAAFVEAFMGLGEQAAAPIQRVGLAAPVAEGLVLNSTADLVEALVGQVGSDRGAVPASRLVGFPGPSPEPDVRLPPHPALHEPMPFGYAAPVVSPLHGVGIAAPR